MIQAPGAYGDKHVSLLQHGTNCPHNEFYSAAPTFLIGRLKFWKNEFFFFFFFFFCMKHFRNERLNLTRRKKDRKDRRGRKIQDSFGIWNRVKHLQVLSIFSFWSGNEHLARPGRIRTDCVFTRIAYFPFVSINTIFTGHLWPYI